MVGNLNRLCSCFRCYCNRGSNRTVHFEYQDSTWHTVIQYVNMKRNAPRDFWTNMSKINFTGTRVATTGRGFKAHPTHAKFCVSILTFGNSCWRESMGGSRWLNSMICAGNSNNCPFQWVPFRWVDWETLVFLRPQELYIDRPLANLSCILPPVARTRSILEHFVFFNCCPIMENRISTANSSAQQAPSQLLNVKWKKHLHLWVITYSTQKGFWSYNV